MQKRLHSQQTTVTPLGEDISTLHIMLDGLWSILVHADKELYRDAAPVILMLADYALRLRDQALSCQRVDQKAELMTGVVYLAGALHSLCDLFKHMDGSAEEDSIYLEQMVRLIESKAGAVVAKPHTDLQPWVACQTDTFGRFERG